jgi:transcriptional regulator with XRE-family HTH domain
MASCSILNRQDNKGNLNSEQEEIKGILMQVGLSPEEQLVERIRNAVGGGTDREIAAKLKVSPASITNWKRGEGPGRKRLKQIAERYKVSLDYLQYGNVDNKDDSEESNGDQNPSLKYESIFKDVLKLNPEHRNKFDAIMEYAEHQVALMLKEQKNEPPRSKGKKS